MDYFKNDDQAIHIGGLAIENGFGQVVIHGNVVLEPGEQSTALLDQFIAELVLLRDASNRRATDNQKEEELPLPLKIIDNPFS
jgi:hypothetical protein